jgi:hypothetical protein
MPSPHDHDNWATRKADKTAAFKKRKAEAKKSGNSKATKKVKPNDALKLAVGDKLTTALMTQYHMMQTKAEFIFNLIYKDVINNSQEN